MQLLIFNEEFLVRPCHQRGLITSLPFVHTARRSYRLNDPVRSLDCGNAAGSPAAMPWEAAQTLSFRGRRSRNKVSVGEPAEGSLAGSFHPHLLRSVRVSRWRLVRLRPGLRPVARAPPPPSRARTPFPPGGLRGLGRTGSVRGPRPPRRAARLLTSRCASRAGPPRPVARACSPPGCATARVRRRARPARPPRPASPPHELKTHNSCRSISWLPQR